MSVIKVKNNGKWETVPIIGSTSGSGVGKVDSNSDGTGEIFNDYENNVSQGKYSHTEGSSNKVLGSASHAEGWSNINLGNNSHTEGARNIANGGQAHAEGYITVADGNQAHTEGQGTETELTVNVESVLDNTFISDTDFNENDILYFKEDNVIYLVTKITSEKTTTVNKTVTISSGQKTVYKRTAGAIANNSHSEGLNTKSIGNQSHSEGNNTIASGNSSHSEGTDTISQGHNSHTEGFKTTSSGEQSHSEGTSTVASGSNSHSEGTGTTASGNNSHSEGLNTISSGTDSHAEGDASKAYGKDSHAEGQLTTAAGNSTHAEGYGTVAQQDYSHAEGDHTKAEGVGAHAEGYKTIASGTYSHAEGKQTQSTGIYSHAEGGNTNSGGEYSHAGGVNCNSDGYASLAHGNHVNTKNNSEIALGKFNVVNEGDTLTEQSLFTIGCGTSDTERENAILITQSGDAYFNGIGDYDGKEQLNDTGAISEAQSLQKVITNINSNISSNKSSITSIQSNISTMKSNITKATVYYIKYSVLLEASMTHTDFYNLYSAVNSGRIVYIDYETNYTKEPCSAAIRNANSHYIVSIIEKREIYTGTGKELRENTYTIDGGTDLFANTDASITKSYKTFTLVTNGNGKQYLDNTGRYSSPPEFKYRILTQSQYDGLSSKDVNTIYFIKES